MIIFTIYLLRNSLKKTSNSDYNEHYLYLDFITPIVRFENVSPWLRIR